MSQCARQTHQARFGGDHVRAVLGARVRRQAANVDDGTHGRQAQQGQRGLTAIKGAIEHHRQGVAPIFYRHLL